MALSTSDAISIWKCNESSGDASDSVGGRTLTNTGSVGYTTGLLGNCAVSSANGTYLRRTDTCTLTSSSDFSLIFYFKISSEDSADHDFFWISNNGNPTGWYVRGLYEYNGGSRRLRFFRSGSSATFLDKTVNVGDNTWHMISFTYTASGGAMTLSLDAGTRVTGTNTGTGNHGASSGTDFLDSGGSGYGASLKGNMDGIYLLNRAITTTEEATLYNAGAGLDYPWGAFTPKTSFFM